MPRKYEVTTSAIAAQGKHKGVLVRETLTLEAENESEERQRGAAKYIALNRFFERHGYNSHLLLQTVKRASH